MGDGRHAAHLVVQAIHGPGQDAARLAGQYLALVGEHLFDQPGDGVDDRQGIVDFVGDA